MLIRTKKLDLEPRFSPYAYQLNAVNEVKDFEYAALFHEQGLGKTKIALDLALYWLDEDVLDTVLIVTKKGLVRNWEKETQVHTSLTFEVIDSNKINNSKKFNKPYRLYIAHYEAVSNSIKTFQLLLKTRRIGVILDEAHHMKNPEGKVATAFFELGPLFTRRVVMTGTPVANRPYDIWSQIYFLDFGRSLGKDFKAFKVQYDLPSRILDSPNRNYEESLKNIFAAIRKFTVRETKHSANIELPNKFLDNIIVPMEARQAELYKEYKDHIKAEVIKNGKLVYDNVENLLKEMLRLVQVASNPMLVDESYRMAPGKAVVLDKLVESISINEKVVVWTNFIGNADYLAERLKKYGCLKLHGKLNIESRNRSVDRFLNNTEKRLLVATPGAAKEGLTLTVASHAIFFDRNFSLNDWLQAQDRIHRISQTRDCRISHLLAENSIDEWVDKLLLCKKKFAMLAQGDDLDDEHNVNSSQSEEMLDIIEDALGL